MKKDNYLILLALTAISNLSLAQDVIKKEVAFKVQVGDLLNPSTSKMYDLSTNNGTDGFIQTGIFSNSAVTKDADLSKIIKSLDLENTAIIFIRHGLDSNALNPVAPQKDLNDIISNERNLSKSVDDLLFQIQFKNKLNLKK